MSTVAEVIAARHMGMKVLAISCVTNMAAGILDQPLSHAEVMETGERVKSTFEALLRAVLPRIDANDVASLKRIMQRRPPRPSREGEAGSRSQHARASHRSCRALHLPAE